MDFTPKTIQIDLQSLTQESKTHSVVTLRISSCTMVLLLLSLGFKKFLSFIYNILNLICLKRQRKSHHVDF